jgi:multidrug efflux system membrane fusion protein
MELFCSIEPAGGNRLRRKACRFQTFLLILTGCFLLSSCSGGKKETPVAPLPVEVAPVAQKKIPIQLKLIGNVQAYSSVSVKSRVAGQIIRVYFKEGDDVKKGDLLFTIDPRVCEAAVKEAEAKLGKDLAMVQQAKANLERDTTQKKKAEDDLQRYKALVEKGAVAKEQYERFQTNAEALDATIRADQAAVENAMAAVQADRAVLENAKIQLGYCSITSPIDGRTGSVIVQEGNIVKENDANLVVINQIHPIYVTFSVPEQYLGTIKKYMAGGKLRVEAVVPNDEVPRGEGVISFIDNAVDTATGTIKLKGTFANIERRLWPGQFANVILTLTDEPDAIVIPSQAVQTGQQGPYVFVVKPDLTVESRSVVVGRTTDGETVIQKGLSAGEKVVTDGQIRLYPGARVEIKSTNSATPPKNKTQ